MFTHLRTHSYYSFLEGLASPAELAQAAAADGLESLALTDHNYLTGAVEFSEACREAGIRPILGLEIAVTPAENIHLRRHPPGRLAFLAIDMQGWANLCRLSSTVLAGTQPDGPAALTPDQLARHSAGLICLTGGSRGLLADLTRDGRLSQATDYLKGLGEIFPDRLYVELPLPTQTDQHTPWRLCQLAQNLALPCAAAHEIWYMRPEQAHLQRLVSAIRLNCRVEQTAAEDIAPAGASYLQAAEVCEGFAAFPEALASASQIANRCRLELPLGRPHYPAISLPAGTTPEEVLRKKSEDGARRLYGEFTPELRRRLDHELQVIGESGYASLFLIMEEILDYARRKGVPYASRGSAASSLVAHCLNITSPDPVKLNLYFERFLNPARATPPDIDTDLCSTRRDEVIRFVYERFGARQVAMVCTIVRYRSRSALRETAKAYGIPDAQIKSLADSLPQRWFGPPWRGRLNAPPYQELQKRYRSPQLQEVFRDAAALIGLPRHLSVHPGGVVIAPGEIVDLVPLQLATKGVVITQLDLEAVERLGLVKIDLLGIRGLTVLGNVAEAIWKDPPVLSAAHAKTNPASHYRSALDVLESIPQDDAATSDMIANGRTIGCFQIESPGMRATLKEIHARSVEDILAALALYRPGPLTGGLKDAFVRRHRGEEAVSHLHEALRPLLDDTYGVILYQEQVLRIAHELAGLSLADADLLRRAMSHFDPGKAMQTLKEKFIAGSFTFSKVPPETAGKVWDLMAAFAGYGFPKAHAASYAVVAWRAAWCKTHYPALFMAAVLANWGGYYSQRVYLTEARRMGLAIRPPHVNHAHREFSVSYLDGSPTLFMGLDQVRELTHRTQERIMRSRPFASLDDFLTRGDPRPVEAENLARCGALSGFGPIPVLIRQIQEGGWRAGQMPLFTLETENSDDWSLEERLAAQADVLGIWVDAHPLELLGPQIETAGALSTLEAAARVGQRLRVAGMRFDWRRGQGPHGERLYRMSLEDLEGMLDVILPEALYRRQRQELYEAGPYVVEGSVELDPETAEPIVKGDRIWLLGRSHAR